MSEIVLLFALAKLTKRSDKIFQCFYTFHFIFLTNILFTIRFVLIVL